MEDMLARERETKEHLQFLLKGHDQPILNILQAFEAYRQVCEEIIFADFENVVANQEAQLWDMHTIGKKYFHKALSGLRKQTNEQPVAMRQLIKLYLQFLKDSQRFYREYISKLNITFGGIPELESVAHQVKSDSKGESSKVSISSELRSKVLDSCHQTLIYLGDLSRYRASEKLDKTPDFGPAIGYYGLACTLRPASGMGQHQQAVVALEQRNHIRAIYHLYRAIVAAEPHPLAANNLKLEFDKTNTAWDRGELIQKGQPNDPEASKRTLVGWFVRLHSMCYKGEQFRGYDELEREVLGQLGVELKHRSLDSTLMRMIMINLTAQYNAGEKFQANPTPQNQTAFLYFFRFNIKTFTAVLRVYYDDLRSVDLTGESEDDELDLVTRVTDIARRVLPTLRLYSSWLLTMTHLLDGLSGDDFLKEAIDQFWPIYAKVIDIVAAIFPIWDLEDLDEITYLLEEDADTQQFKPLMNERTNKIWCYKTTGQAKPRFFDHGVERSSADEEMLGRVRDLLSDGLILANDDDTAPIKLRGIRILHRDAEEPEVLPETVKLPVPPASEDKAVNDKPAPKAKPLSYAAAAAANGPGKKAARATGPNGVNGHPNSRHAQLSRMVDDLVDDDESNTPVTPPQQNAVTPVVVTKGDVSYGALPGSAKGFAQMPSYAYQAQQKPIGSGTNLKSTPPSRRTPQHSAARMSTDWRRPMPSMWNDYPSQNASSSSNFPAGLPTGTLGSPAPVHSQGHSRVNSASSIRSRASQNLNLGIADSWSSIESAPRSTTTNGLAPPVSGAAFGSQDQSTVASPLLFGAGGGVWSTSPNSRYRNVSPSNQGLG